MGDKSVSEKNTYVTIPVRANTKQMLEKMKGDKDWDTLLRELVNKKQQEDEIIVIPDSIRHEDILLAIEQVKPPSKYREMVFFFMIATLGGIGLGLVIP